MYFYVKALHVFAVVLLIGGILLMALAITFCHADTDERTSRFIGTALRWDRLVTAPALAAVWIAGFTLVFGAGWETSIWLLFKMVPVVFLTGLYAVQGVVLRRALRGGPPPPLFLRHAPAATLIAFAIVAWLAVVKPF